MRDGGGFQELGIEKTHPEFYRSFNIQGMPVSFSQVLAPYKTHEIAGDWKDKWEPDAYVLHRVESTINVIQRPLDHSLDVLKNKSNRIGSFTFFDTDWIRLSGVIKQALEPH
jgi:hypothetical protein